MFIPILNLNIEPNIQPSIEPNIEHNIEPKIEYNIACNIETQYWNLILNPILKPISNPILVVNLLHVSIAIVCGYYCSRYIPFPLLLWKKDVFICMECIVHWLRLYSWLMKYSISSATSSKLPSLELNFYGSATNHLELCIWVCRFQNKFQHKNFV